MRVLLLNGALGPDPLLDELAARVRHDCELRGAVVETALLRIERVAWCQGCFECWTKTPGECKIHDDGRDLARDFAQADAVVLLTPSRFGGYSSETKKLLDRTLALLLPFFRRLDGETHHRPRYESRPSLGVLAVLEHEDFDATETLRVLVERNAVNFASPNHHLEIVTRASSPGVRLTACDALVDALFAAPGRPRALRHPDDLLPAMAREERLIAPRQALVLVGSAKPRGQSASEALGVALMERLGLRGVGGAVRYAHRDTHGAAGVDELLAAVRAVDLLVIASPVYIDSLPSMVTRALELIADERASADAPPPLSVTMLLNCGFPEARHASIARTMGALFARDARATWAGAIQVGGGGLVAGDALAGAGHVARRLAPVLDAAADSLSRGERLSDDVIQRAQEPLIPARAYTAAADAAWLWTAAHEGALGRLWQRPAMAAARATTRG